MTRAKLNYMTAYTTRLLVMVGKTYARRSGKTYQT